MKLRIPKFHFLSSLYIKLTSQSVSQSANKPVCLSVCRSVGPSVNQLLTKYVGSAIHQTISLLELLVCCMPNPFEYI